MRRADRLFQLIEILRRARRPITAETIATELETSKRTIYRDIADLMAQRVPIRGEAGLGYVLEAGFDLPPLMLTADEIEAAVLGAQWVARNGDPDLVRAALGLTAKIGAVVPERLRSYVLEPVTVMPPRLARDNSGVDPMALRAQIRAGRKIRLDYRDEQGQPSERIIWPIAIGYLDVTRLLIAWCELREDFRHFRLDRIVGMTLLEARYPGRPASLRAQWRRLLDNSGKS